MSREGIGYQGLGESDITPRVAEYWNEASCGTRRVRAAKHSREYFDEIERFRYQHEPFIHSFAQFSRWRGRRVLEVGVGAGTDLLQFARSGARVSGIDLTEEAIRNAEAVLSLHGLVADDLRAGNSEALPYPDGAFDLVYSWGVIHHAHRMDRSLAEIVRVTRPGGRVKVMVYNRNSLFAWYLCGRYGLARGKLGRGRRDAIWHHMESYGTKAYTRREIEDLLRPYAPQDLRFYFWEQQVRAGARFERLRRTMQRFTPREMLWYMGFEFDRSA